MLWLSLIIISRLIAPPSTYAQAAVSEAKLALEMWEPLAIEQQGKRLVITSKERQVTSTIYYAMMSNICLYAGTGEIQLVGITEILILNRFQRSGWVFEGGRSACMPVFKAPSGKVQIRIAGQTHLYSLSIDGAIE